MREDRTNKDDSNLLSTQDWAPVAEFPLEETISTAATSDHEDSAPQREQPRRSVMYTNKKSWWRRFLAGEPPDPREAERQAIPGLVAYFFTGGPPIAHKVHDISANGIYILTKERWYPNTIVRVTLSDERDPSRELSLSLHARVARFGDDGVGMHFILTEKKDLDRANAGAGNDPIIVVTREQLDDFVRNFKASLG